MPPSLLASVGRHRSVIYASGTLTIYNALSGGRQPRESRGISGMTHHPRALRDYWHISRATPGRACRRYVWVGRSCPIFEPGIAIRAHYKIGIGLWKG